MPLNNATWRQIGGNRFGTVINTVYEHFKSLEFLYWARTKLISLKHLGNMLYGRNMRLLVALYGFDSSKSITDLFVLLSAFLNTLRQVGFYHLLVQRRVELHQSRQAVKRFVWIVKVERAVMIIGIVKDLEVALFLLFFCDTRNPCRKTKSGFM